MAKLKANKDVEVDVEVKVEDTVIPTTEEGYTPDEEENVVQVETEDETLDVEVEVVEVKTEEPKVAVDVTPVNNTTQATPKNVRIRMKVDHKCWVNDELYDLKKGQHYTVPISVKKRLNKAGVLLPL